MVSAGNKIILTSLFWLCFNSSYAQDSLKNTSLGCKSVVQVHNHFLTASYQFMFNPVGKTIGAQGTIAGIGFNFARFFSRKIILGVSADIKFIPGFATKRPSNNFRNEFNSAFISTYDNESDSANAFTVHQALNQEQLFGNNVFNVGLMFSPFPQAYGGILFQVKYGTSGFMLHNVFGNKFINGGGNDKVAMNISGNWQCEMSIKPLAFSRYTQISLNNLQPDDIFKSLIISLFYERLNFSSAEFNGTHLDKMVTSSFMHKYGIDHRFGVKLGFAFY